MFHNWINKLINTVPRTLFEAGNVTVQVKLYDALLSFKVSLLFLCYVVLYWTEMALWFHCKLSLQWQYKEFYSIQIWKQESLFI